LRKVIKKLVLAVPPVRKVHTDLENRRRRVAELEGHLQVMKKQMARALNNKNSATLSESTVASDVKYIKGERDKTIEQNKLLADKYDALYRDFCILSMSNEALLNTNASLLNGDFSAHKKAVVKASTVRKKSTVKKTSKPKKTLAKTRKTKMPVKARQK